jgi:hypothetical protein
LLDALTYARCGSWQSFTNLASQVDDSPWFAVETARLLSALGHIEFALDTKTLGLESWMIAPPAIVLLPGSEEAVLCGSRSARLLTRLAEIVDAQGGTVTKDPTTSAPTVVKFTGLDQGGLSSVAESVGSSLNQPITAVRDLAIRLLGALPSLSKIAGGLPTRGWPSLPSERYEVGTSTWVPTIYPDRPAAYRFGGQPRTYAYLEHSAVLDRTLRIGDSRLVKHLAACNNRGLLAYDPANRELITPLGAQLPGLFERVAVLCSGLPPIAMSDGTVKYTAVPSLVAAGLWRKLTT